MRISPELLARLLACSFFAGFILAVLNGLARAATVLIDGRSLCKNSRLENFLTRPGKARQNDRKRTDFSSRIKQSRVANGVRAAFKQCYIFIVDFLLFILAAAAVILLCFYLNYGEIRGFCILGMLCGFFLCRLTLGNVLMLAFGELNLVLRFLICAAIRIILSPLTIFLHFCKKIFKFFNIKIKNALEKRKKVLYNNNELLYIYTLSEKGFDFISGTDGDYNDSDRSRKSK